jgi:hypothetical protein
MPCSLRSSEAGTAGAKDHLAYLIAQAFDFLRIGGIPESLGQVEEYLLFAFLSSHDVSRSTPPR